MTTNHVYIKPYKLVVRRERPYITSADIMSAGALDIYWNELVATSQFAGGDGKSGVLLTIAELTEMQYGVFVGSREREESRVQTASFMETCYRLVSRRYEKDAVKGKPSQLSINDGGNQASTEDGIRFRWTFDDSFRLPLVAVAGSNNTLVDYSDHNRFLPDHSRFGSTYTAFALEVKSGSTVVYSATATRLPVRDEYGRYVWEAPLAALAGVLTRPGTYQWRVAMCNAKYHPNAKKYTVNWSDYSTFTVA